MSNKQDGRDEVLAIIQARIEYCEREAARLSKIKTDTQYLDRDNRKHAAGAFEREAKILRGTVDDIRSQFKAKRLQRQAERLEAKRSNPVETDTGDD